MKTFVRVSEMSQPAANGGVVAADDAAAPVRVSREDTATRQGNIAKHFAHTSDADMKQCNICALKVRCPDGKGMPGRAGHLERWHNAIYLACGAV